MLIRLLALTLLATASLQSSHSSLAAGERADPTIFLLTPEELPSRFVQQHDRDEDQTTAHCSRAYRVYWRFNPEIAADDITSLHMGATVYDSSAAASEALARQYPQMARDFERVQPTDQVGDEGFILWHSIPEVGRRQAEAWYIV